MLSLSHDAWRHWLYPFGGNLCTLSVLVEYSFATMKDIWKPFDPVAKGRYKSVLRKTLPTWHEGGGWPLCIKQRGHIHWKYESLATQRIWPHFLLLCWVSWLLHQVRAYALEEPWWLQLLPERPCALCEAVNSQSYLLHCRPVNSHDLVVRHTILSSLSRSHDNSNSSHDCQR